MITALEQSFIDICETHDVRSLSVSFTVSEKCPPHFTVFAHRGDQCAGEHGDTIAEAMGKAIAILNAKDIALADEALPVGEIA